MIPCYLFRERQICTPQAVQSGSKPQTPRKTTSLSVPQSPSQFAMQTLSQSCCLTALSQRFCRELPPGTQQLLQETRGLPPAFPSPRLPSVLSYGSTEMQRCLEIPFMRGDTGDSSHLRDAPQGTRSPTHGASILLHIAESGLSQQLSCQVPLHALKGHFLFKCVDKQMYLLSPPLFK